MSKMIILRGIPASGKSTWAKKKQKEDPSFKRVNRDELRAMLDNKVYSTENEALIRTISTYIILQQMTRGGNIIVDDTNLSNKFVDGLKELVLPHKCTIEEKWFDISLEEALERNANRSPNVPEEVIHRMYKQYQELKKCV